MKCWHFLTLNSNKMNQNRSEIRNQHLSRILVFVSTYLLSYLRKCESIKDVVHLCYGTEAMGPLLYLFSILWSQNNKVLIILSSTNANCGQQSVNDRQRNESQSELVTVERMTKKKKENWWISCELCQKSGY